jgi:hypothetical protein
MSDIWSDMARRLDIQIILIKLGIIDFNDEYDEYEY